MQRDTQGWLKAGEASDALDALSGLDPQWGFHPHVLLAHWESYSRTKHWKGAYAISLALVFALPDEPIGWIYRAFALKQLGRVNEAVTALLPAARKFPTDWRIPYNLACYVCQSGDVAGAWNWLDRAIELGDANAIRCAALDDLNLKPLWEKLGALAEN